MTVRRLSPLELRIMEALWSRGAASVREVQETFPEAERPAYATVQTTITGSKPNGRFGASRKSVTPTFSRPSSRARPRRGVSLTSCCASSAGVRSRSWRT